MLVVSHDRTFLTNVCTDVIHLHSQRLTSYRGDYEVSVRVRYIVLSRDQLVLLCYADVCPDQNRTSQESAERV